MNIKLILYYLRWFLIPISGASLFVIAFSYFTNDKEGILSYLFVFLLSISLFFLLNFFKGKKLLNKLNLKFLILIGWVILPVIISFPYFLSYYNIDLFSSYYESVSGFLSFGLSIFLSPEQLDKPILLWRSLSQWLGGFYFLFSVISIFSSFDVNFIPHKYISNVENSLNFENKFFKNFLNILYCYFLLSLIILFFLNFTSFSFFQKLNLMMTIVSSGGFYIENNLSVNNNIDSFILSFCFLFSSLNIFIFYEFFKFSKNYSFQEDLNVFFVVIVISFLLLFVFFKTDNFTDIFLLVTTSISTSGIPLSINSNLLLKDFFLILTFVGGCVYSTGSGFKFFRILFFIKKFFMELMKLLNPSIIIKKNIFSSSVSIKNSDYYIASLIFIFFLLLFFVSILLLSFDNLSFENTYKLAFLVLNNTHPQNYLNNKLDFYDLSYLSHIVILFLLFISKIYFISIFVLIKKALWK